MGNNKSPKKPTVNKSHNLSARLLPFTPSQTASPSTSKHPSPSPASSVSASASDEAGLVITQDQKKVDAAELRKAKRKLKKKTKMAAKAAAADAARGQSLVEQLGGKGRRAEDEDEHMEEGEIDEFANCFMVDLEPTMVKSDAAYSEQPPPPTPTSLGPSQPTIKDVEIVMDEPSASIPGKQAHQDPKIVVQEKTPLEIEEEEMRNFANEVAETDSSEDDDDEAEEEEDMLYDDEYALEKAIQGKIADDTAAKVTGRYYKEADMTRHCGLCGEQGHTSRDCTHAQCFTCGLVDGDHEARSCPVTLVCSSCGSRGHISRNCLTPHGMRTPYHARCSICSSGLHLAINCPTLWRVYNTKDPVVKKGKTVYACANCAAKDHFVDDCLLPRMHPVRNADASAFNAAALGTEGSSGAYSAQRPPAGGIGSGAAGSAAASRRRQESMRMQDDNDSADDDWFASRRSGLGNDRGRGRGGAAAQGGSRPSPYSSGGGGKGGKFAQRNGNAPSRGTPNTHIHFGSGGGGKDRFGTPQNQNGKGNYERKPDLLNYGSATPGSSRRGGRGGSESGMPSLASRLAPASGGRGKPAPRYHGGYT